MERMLVVIFDDEKKAYEGSRALYQLDMEGSISIHAESVISKNTDGKLTIKQADGDFPIRTLAGTALGSLIGLLGGPIGFGIGAVAGAYAGVMGDVWVAGVDGEFLDDVSKALKPGKYAVVADVSEEWVTPVDTSMEALGGAVYRTARSGVEQEQMAREQAAIRADIASLKAEHAKAQAERKARLQSKIEQLETKLQGKLRRNQQQREELQREMDAKVHAVEQRAAKAKGDAKAALEARAASLRAEFKLGKVKGAAAGEVGAQH
jgi:uncharacterized membrane protein